MPFCPVGFSKIAGISLQDGLRAAAARTGQLLNITDMARDSGVSPVTAKHWLILLETSGIICLLSSLLPMSESNNAIPASFL